MLKVAVLMSCVILVVESIVELFALKLRFRLGILAIFLFFRSRVASFVLILAIFTFKLLSLAICIHSFGLENLGFSNLTFLLIPNKFSGNDTSNDFSKFVLAIARSFSALISEALIKSNLACASCWSVIVDVPTSKFRFANSSCSLTAFFSDWIVFKLFWAIKILK